MPVTVMRETSSPGSRRSSFWGAQHARKELWLLGSRLYPSGSLEQVGISVALVHRKLTYLWVRV